MDHLQWIGVVGLSFWRHPFTAEDPLVVSKWCNAKFYLFWWKKLIHVDVLRISTFSANLHFWVKYSFKGRLSNFWKPMLIFEITKTNTPLPQKGLTPILIDPPKKYVACTTQAMISSLKQKPLFLRNYLEKYFPGIFSPDLLLSAFPSWSKGSEKIRQIVWWLNIRLRLFLNTKYANFGLSSSVVRNSRVRLGSVSSCGRNDASPVILQTAALCYLITSVSSPRPLKSSSLYLQTKYIKHHCLF